ncbi:thrombospondin type 3 repeat-containing protein [Candidatus Micrarchaeota archaeon]|nr:thrombospondin type 3 repeat-containing protein [Candidatus Micrarchaeota archaeon]
MNKLFLLFLLFVSLSFSTWTDADCKSACSAEGMKFTVWVIDADPEPCDDVQRAGPNSNGLVTFSCAGSDGTLVFKCGCYTQCADGLDNDGGGKTDLEDPGCEDKKDNDETSECQDGIDNDGGGKIDMEDPGCSDPEDNNEISQCQDGIDNDNGGKIDMADAGCTGPEDNDEIGECQDGKDNDLGGKIDMDDPGCSDPETDADETSECQDGLDNDKDGKIDLEDNGCMNEEDNREEQKICRFSILITGGIDDINNDPFFWRETEKKYEIITKNWGTSSADTYLLYFNGSINKTHNDARIDGPATLAQIEKVFEEIAKKAKECTDRCDHVEITIFGGNHGAEDGMHLFGAEKLSPAKLRELIQKIQNTANKDKASVWLDMSHCYSGLFTELSDVADGVAAAVRHNETAGYNSTLEMSFQWEFSDAMAKNLTWKECFDHAKKKIHDWGWDDETVYVWNETEHPQYNGTDPVCGDGKISKSVFFGNKSEECDPGDASKNIIPKNCPEHLLCHECKCVPIHHYLDCVNGTCIMKTSPAPTENHPLCTEEGANCIPIEELLDTDKDGIPNSEDNCPEITNPSQSDLDEDGIGDVCDPCPHDFFNDIDGDGVCGDVDNCPYISNENQKDEDGDGFGDVCDMCPEDVMNDMDYDSYCESEDNCPYTYNPSQSDLDDDGIGDHCDLIPVDCELFCYEEGYPEVLGEGVSEYECMALGEEYESVECHTTCIYIYYKPWQWTSNSYSCCCRNIEYYACEDCPGENPICPECPEK